MQSLYSMCDGSLCPLRELTHKKNFVFKKERIFIVAFYFYFTQNIIDIFENLFLFLYVEILVSTSVAVTCFFFLFFCALIVAIKSRCPLLKC